MPRCRQRPDSPQGVFQIAIVTCRKVRDTLRINEAADHFRGASVVLGSRRRWSSERPFDAATNHLSQGHALLSGHCPKLPGLLLRKLDLGADHGSQCNHIML